MNQRLDANSTQGLPAEDPATGRVGDERIRAEAARWEKDAYRAETEIHPERRSFVTDIGLKVNPLYTPADLADAGHDYLSDLGFPGEYPFTRGERAAMYRTEPFVISAYSGFGEASECNGRFRKLLDWGAEQILVALDLPTQCGYDSDHEMATAEVGQVGVALSTLADMEALFDGISIDKVKRIGTLGNSIGPIVLAMFAALGERRGLKASEFTVNLQNDPLKEYIARGTQILPAKPAAKLASDCVAWCVDHEPGWSPMTVCVNHLNAGGAGSSRATAIALANAIHYIGLLLEKGYTIDQVAPLLHMFADERHDFFVIIANLRALRRIWARMMKERYGATLREAMALRTTVYGHGQEALGEPLNNIARTAFGTLGYVLGGASYVYIASYDEAVSTPTEDSIRTALRTEEIIAHEHGFTDTIDPLGGSYFVESLTNRIEAQILDALREVEEAGGALRVIDAGLGRRWMTEGALRRQRAIDSGDRPWVTVNLWPQKPHVPNTAFRIHPDNERRQAERLRQVRAARDEQRVRRALAGIDEACRTGANMVPPTLEAVKAYASVGEIAERWRRHYGVFSPSTDF
ncbi:MAG: methylmalonyl-CoA mutase [Betaproteobacteria bacterium]|nr:methylmalonyl-CoA mutase [Betaproteobacteria bacterium]